MNLKTIVFFSSFQLFITFSFCSQDFSIKINSSALLRDKERGVGFAGFKKHKHRYLNVVPISTEFVKTVKKCVLLAAINPSTFSFNVAVHSNVRGLRRCELLRTDLFNNTDKLVVNSSYNHYSIGSPCADHPCVNGGSCIAMYTSGDYQCNCTSGFTEKNCRKDIDECVSNPCRNHGTCVNLYGSFTCTCTLPYIGQTCNMIDLCSSNPCLNQGTCTNQPGGYSCSCPVEFAGTRCQTKVCRPGWTERQGKCYKVFTTLRSWNNAASDCRTHGSNITSITSLEESNFLKILVGIAIADPYVWIGLNDIAVEGAHEWVDGSPLTFTSWKEDQPNDPGGVENCVDFQVASGLWHDFGCHHLERYVCKYLKT